MVRLDRIATRTGDDGSTALGDGRRLAKHHPLIEALGTVDEANSLFGLLRLEILPDIVSAALPSLQNALFDLGADLCIPLDSPHAARVARVDDAAIARLDRLLEEANHGLPPLTSFVLPGGTRAGATLHLARTVVRRGERALSAAIAAGQPPLNQACLRWLNRLSDLCFVWARRCNIGAEPLWEPRKPC